MQTKKVSEDSTSSATSVAHESTKKGGEDADDDDANNWSFDDVFIFEDLTSLDS